MEAAIDFSIWALFSRATLPVQSGDCVADWPVNLVLDHRD